MKLKVFVAVLVVSLVGGCSAANSSRGVIAMKISDTEAHACVRKLEVKVGDKMELFRNECSIDSGSPKTMSVTRGRSRCKLTRIGEGTISEQLNDHYSVLKFDTPTNYQEGDLLEKVTR